MCCSTLLSVSLFLYIIVLEWFLHLWWVWCLGPRVCTPHKLLILGLSYKLYKRKGNFWHVTCTIFTNDNLFGDVGWLMFDLLFYSLASIDTLLIANYNATCQLLMTISLASCYWQFNLSTATDNATCQLHMTIHLSIANNNVTCQLLMTMPPVNC